MWRISPCRWSSARAAELLRDRAFGRAVDADHAAQVDHVERVQAEVAQVVVHRLRQLRRRERRLPRAVRGPRRAPTLVTITRPSG